MSTEGQESKEIQEREKRMENKMGKREREKEGMANV